MTKQSFTFIKPTIFFSRQWVLTTTESRFCIILVPFHRFHGYSFKTLITEALLVLQIFSSLLFGYYWIITRMIFNMEVEKCMHDAVLSWHCYCSTVCKKSLHIIRGHNYYIILYIQWVPPGRYRAEFTHETTIIIIIMIMPLPTSWYCALSKKEAVFCCLFWPLSRSSCIQSWVCHGGTVSEISAVQCMNYSY